jgi:hypothetical protein
MVPREGAPASYGASYGSPRTRHVEFVDYSRPGDVVVYIDGSPATPSIARFEIRATNMGAYFSPAFQALGAGGAIEVSNSSSQPHTLSCPAAGLVQTVGPGETSTIPVPEAGEIALYLLDEARSPALAFASPGPYAVVSQSGRFSLENVAPGLHQLRTWHPRFPESAYRLELAPDTVSRLDLEIGVGRGTGETTE